MGLVERVLNFFSPVALYDNNKAGYLSVDDCMKFLDERNEGVQLRTLLGVVKKFENEGFLLKVGQKGTDPIYGATYTTQTLSTEKLSYGSYSFYYHGFASIRYHFSKSVLPIDVTKPNDDKGIGTCFVIDSNKLLTARHCIEDLKDIKVYDPQNQLVEPSAIWIPDDDSDMAIIEMYNYNFASVPALKIDIGYILDEVLTMGYPPIPGFDAIQVADTSHIGSLIKASSGRITAEERTLWDKDAYYLINAKVKGGNSGGPIINNLGYAIGMITDIPLDPEEQEKIDHLAYGVAITGMRIRNFLSAVVMKKPDLPKLPLKNGSQGFSTL